MNRTIEIVIAATILMISGLIVMFGFGGTSDNLGSVNDDVEDTVCGDFRERFEAEKNSGSMLRAYSIKQRAEESGCSWPSEVSLNYQPNECPSAWVIAC